MDGIGAAFLRGLGVTSGEFGLILAMLAVLGGGLLIALVVILFREADHPRWTKRRCPRCAEPVSGLARACGRCGQAMTADA